MAPHKAEGPTGALALQSIEDSKGMDTLSPTGLTARPSEQDKMISGRLSSLALPPISFPRRPGLLLARQRRLLAQGATARGADHRQHQVGGPALTCYQTRMH